MKDRRHSQAEGLLHRLKAEHEVLKHCRPLSETDIESALIQAHPEEEPWLIRLAVHLHVNSDAYLQSVSHGGFRYALDGTPAGEVDADDRHHARSLLKHHRTHESKRRRDRRGGKGH